MYQQGFTPKFMNRPRCLRTDCMIRPNPQESLVEIEERSVGLLRRERMIGVRAVEGGFVLRIGNAVLPSERCELFATAVANRLHQAGVAMAGEVLKWSGLAVL